MLEGWLSHRQKFIQEMDLKENPIYSNILKISINPAPRDFLNWKYYFQIVPPSVKGLHLWSVVSLWPECQSNRIANKKQSHSTREMEEKVHNCAFNKMFPGKPLLFSFPCSFCLTFLRDFVRVDGDSRISCLSPFSPKLFTWIFTRRRPMDWNQTLLTKKNYAEEFR